MPIVANFLPLNTSLIRRVCANFDKLQALPLGEDKPAYICCLADERTQSGKVKSRQMHRTPPGEKCRPSILIEIQVGIGKLSFGESSKQEANKQ